ncbi:hypothetical protein SNE40_009248 [Patella caerulea]|uniref:Sulfotransferase domain-containing protein n=1 Tax=Patella caerulea TaxID=87958 RepID=A0AAN8JS64_PATCE
MEEVSSNVNIKYTTLTDKSGHDFNAVEVDGIPMAIFPDELKNATHEEHLKKVKEMEMRDDDVIICAYPKAGTHWLWEVIQMLNGQTTNYKTDCKEQQMLEATDLAVIDREKSPRVLNSHFWLRHLPKQIFEKKTKIVSITRNPKDTAVSWFCHLSSMELHGRLQSSFKDFIDMFLFRSVPFGSWFDYVLEWDKFCNTSNHPVYRLTYEDMQENPVDHVKGLAKFLEIDVSDELCEAIVDACSFKKLKKADADQKGDKLGLLFKDGASMYRKGKVGDWKNWFTVAESEIFDQVTDERMKDCQVKLKYFL